MSELKAFPVEVTTIAVVMAKDMDHAVQVAKSNHRDICSDDPHPRFTARLPLSKAEDAGHGWDGNCIPYGGDGNTSLGEYLAKSGN